MPKKKTFPEYLIDFKVTHGDKYDYPPNQTLTKGASTKIRILCPTHGEFLQAIQHHKAGSGCQRCASERTAKGQTRTYEDYLPQLREIHQNKYSYPEYQDLPNRSSSKIKITCPTHGDFEQVIVEHAQGHGCPSCGREKTTSSHLKSYTSCLEDFKEVHGTKYTYPGHQDLPEGVYSTITITCPTHGDFKQVALNHFYGNGCQKCGNNATSKPESEVVEALLDIDATLKIERNVRMRSTTGKLMELDIYLPDHNLGIEYHGLYWHSEDKVGQKYHRQKRDFFNDMGIQVVQVFGHEWLSKKKIVLSIIKSKLNIPGSRIFARKCKVKEISSKDYRDFLERNHLQGHVGATIKLGLYSHDTLVQLVSFSKPRYSSESEWENIRSCTKINTIVVGGFSKLLAAFRREHLGTITSFVDLRYFNGASYLRNGFTLQHISKPNFFYFYNSNNPDKVYSRITFQKHKLKDKLPNFDESKTAVENMRANGYLRFFDAGNLVLTLA